MRARQVIAIPVVAAIVLSGAVTFGGCGSGSDASTTDQAQQSTQHEDAIKGADSSMKQEEATKHDEEVMKQDEESMQGDGGAVKHGGAMKDEITEDQMEG